MNDLAVILGLLIPLLGIIGVAYMIHKDSQRYRKSLQK